MNYNFSGIGVEITADIRAYLEKKLVHVEKFMHANAAYTLDADLKYDAGIADKKFTATFTLIINGTTLYTEAGGHTAYEAIDIAAAELAREAAAYKSKHKSLVRRGAARAKAWLQGLRG